MIKYIVLSISFFSFCFSNTFEEDFKLGEKIYFQTCVSCHGEDGKAKNDLKLIVKPRDLTKTILTNEQTYLITKDGAHFWGAKADIMPAFKYVLNDKQLKSVAYFISEKFHPQNEKRIEKIYEKSENIPQNKLSKMLKRGEKVFNRNCKYCHGDTGKGDGEATKNPEDSIFPYNLTKTLLTQKQMFLYVKYGGKHWGTYKDDMPAWKVKYDDFTLKSVARYVDEVVRGDK